MIMYMINIARATLYMINLKAKQLSQIVYVNQKVSFISNFKKKKINHNF